MAVSTQVLQTSSSWNGVAYEPYPDGTPQLTVVRYSIPANSSLPWHVHHMPSAAYVISAQITVEEQTTGRTLIVRAGEAFAESVGSVHRGYTGDEPAEILATYSGREGLPLSVQEE